MHARRRVHGRREVIIASPQGDHQQPRVAMGQVRFAIVKLVLLVQIVPEL